MNVKLKPATPNDYDEYYKIRCSPADIYWNGYESAPDKECFRTLYLNRLGNSPLDKAEDRRLYLIQIENVNVGFLQLIKREDGIDIGYTIIEEFQHQGYATEALIEGITIAKKLDDRIYVQIRDDNIASQGVALKCGLVRTNEYEERKYPIAGMVRLRKYRLELDK